MEKSDQTRNTRLIFLSIIGIPIMVVLAATWLWFFVARGDLDLVAILGTSNQGSLVQPARSLDEGNLLDSAGAAFSYSDLPPQWTFLVAGKGSCSVDCEKLLYLTRQIHLAMGKELGRIRRFYVSDSAVSETVFGVDTLSDKRPAPADFQKYMQAEQLGMKAFTVPPDRHASLFAETYDDPTTWYLVDPAGWIMMSYTSEISYKMVISDLKFLLKNSSE
ncbi:MAG: hypothetical protein ACI8QT_000213 [Halioglobus sp.]|jgi:hypothetical protein